MVDMTVREIGRIPTKNEYSSLQYNKSQLRTLDALLAEFELLLSICSGHKDALGNGEMNWESRHVVQARECEQSAS